MGIGLQLWGELFLTLPAATSGKQPLQLARTAQKSQPYWWRCGWASHDVVSRAESVPIIHLREALNQTKTLQWTLARKEIWTNVSHRSFHDEVFNCFLYFFLNFVWGCCNGRGQIWDNREMNGVTMHDGKITQNTLKERKLSKKVKNE